MKLLDNRPAGNFLRAEKAIHQPDRAIVGGGPAALKQARIVENHAAAGLDEAAPVVPIAADATLRVVAVDQQQIDRQMPLLRAIGTELFNPEHFTARTRCNRAMRATLHKIKRRNAAEMKWIDQVQGRFGRHAFAQRKGRNALGHADFDNRGAAAGPFFQGGVFFSGVLSEERARSEKSVERMPKGRNKGLAVVER